MQIKFICTYWGQDHLTVSEFIDKAMKEGYDGIEVNVPFDPQSNSSLQQAVEANGALLILQQWLPPARETAGQYHSRMVDHLKHLVRMNPLFINSHTGKDYFSFDDNCRLIESCRDISENSGISILHETHRGRFAFHAHSLAHYIHKYPELQFTADLSHLCNVSESLLEYQEDLLESIIGRSRYIHARVGSDQSAQVNNPFAPEWESTLKRFTGWWQQIVDEARKRGDQVFHICPEFGPVPYLQVMPFTQKPVSDQWEVNLQMMHYLKEHLQ